MAKIPSKYARRLRRAFELEHLLLEDDDVVEYLASMVVDFPAEEQIEDNLIDDLLPYIEDRLSTLDAGRETCRAALQNYRNLPDDSTSEGGASPEASHGKSGELFPGDSHEDEDELDKDEEGSRTVWGLHEWLKRLHLVHYMSRAREWCAQQHAIYVEEVQECHDDFCKDLNLKALERRRVKLDIEEMLSRRQTTTEESTRTEVVAAKPKRTIAPASAAGIGGGKVGSIAAQLPPPAKFGGLHRAESQSGPGGNAARQHRRETFGRDGSEYCLCQEIGAGATATVYTCCRDNTVFAVKAITLARLPRATQNSKAAMEKLHRETQILYSMRHRNIVTLYDVVETKDKLYLVMEYIEGGELTQYVAKHDNGALFEHEARYVFLQLVLGLRYIHTKGIVHRDLKPQNILVDKKASRPGLLEVKISDFGQSKIVNDGYDIARTQVGTPIFWAPEVNQITGTGYDQSVDLWSLGVLLYWMIEGRVPEAFLLEVTTSASKAIGPERLWTKTSKAGEEGKDIVQRLLKLRPSERLSLADCLGHPWSMIKGGPLSKVLRCREEVDRLARGEQERQALLPGDPKDVPRLRRELQELTIRHQVPAVLRRRMVVLLHWKEHSPEQVEMAWNGLTKLLEAHFPRGRIERHDFKPCSNVFPGLFTVPESGRGANQEGAAQDEKAALNKEKDEEDEAEEPEEEEQGDQVDNANDADPNPETDDVESDRETAQTAVRCSRVCIVTPQHDDRTDTARFSIARGAPEKLQSIWSHLNNLLNNKSDITGFLSFGKPGVLLFEGPAEEVKRMAEQVQALPGWFNAQERWQSDGHGIQDVTSWRAYTDFFKVKGEDLKDLLLRCGFAHAYEELIDRGPDHKKRASRAKHKQ